MIRNLLELLKTIILVSMGYSVGFAVGIVMGITNFIHFYNNLPIWLHIMNVTLVPIGIIFIAWGHFEW
jgi:hypothetical protein